MAWISLGEPSASTSPRSKTVMRSQCDMTKVMSCSTNKMAHEPSVRSSIDDRAETLHLGVAQPGRRFVEQEQRWRLGQRSAELDHSRRTDGKGSGHGVADRPQPAELHELVDLDSPTALDATSWGQSDQVGQDAAPSAPPFERAQQVLFHRQAAEHLLALERPAHAGP